MASQKISELPAVFSLASGDYFPLVTSADDTNRRVETSVLQASGNAALEDVGVALASGNAALDGLDQKYNITGGPITGAVTTQSQSIGNIDDQALTSGTIVLDFSGSNNFEFVLGGNSTLSAPTLPSGGQTGVITIRQDDVGSRTLAYASVWQFAGGTPPTLTTTASGVDLISYYVTSPTEIQSVSTLNF